MILIMSTGKFSSRPLPARPGERPPPPRPNSAVLPPAKPSAKPPEPKNMQASQKKFV